MICWDSGTTIKTSSQYESLTDYYIAKDTFKSKVIMAS